MHFSTEDTPLLDRFDKAARDRKRDIYWIGFLGGALASGRIETGEDAAILAEAEAFARFFGDPDASDLAQDLRGGCFADEADAVAAIADIIAAKQAALDLVAPRSDLDAVNEFLGFCAGVVCDGQILPAEAEALRARLRETRALHASVVFADLWRALEGALADNELTPAEAEELRDWISLLVGDGFAETGLANIGAVAQLDTPITDPTEVLIEGNVFVLTGPMRLGPRSFIISEISRCGGTVAATVSRKTGFVVLSATASKHWRTSHFGTKIEAAKALIEQGYPLRFVTEAALAQAIARRDAAQ